MLLLLVGALLPVMYLGRYNHPTGDDYYYGAQTHLVWQETGSAVKTLAEAGRGVIREYGQWQGTYSALFLMYLAPNIFGNLPYRLVTTVILLLLVGGIFYWNRCLLGGWLKLPVAARLIVSSCLSLLCVETVPSQGETFFWYNGAMYYTGYFAVTLFFLGSLLCYIRRQGVLRLVLLLLLALFLAGGNYVSLLPCLILLTLAALVLHVQRRKGAWGVTAVTLAMLAGLIVSAAAPGNRIRQDGMWQIPAWKAVAKALLQGLAYMRAWIGGWWLLAALLLTPVLWKYLKKSSFRFRFPLLAVALCYGIFCSMSCPTFYTMNSTGPARAVAVVYYGFLLFSFAAYGYVLGFLQRICTKAPAKAVKVGLAAAAAALAVFLLLTGACVGTTTGKAARLLASGEAAAYEAEYQERYRLLTASGLQEVVLEPYVNQPDMLYVGDFSADPQEPTNLKVAEFFGKSSVRVDYK